MGFLHVGQVCLRPSHVNRQGPQNMWPLQVTQCKGQAREVRSERDRLRQQEKSQAEWGKAASARSLTHQESAWQPTTQSWQMAHVNCEHRTSFTWRNGLALQLMESRFVAAGDLPSALPTLGCAALDATSLLRVVLLLPSTAICSETS